MSFLGDIKAALAGLRPDAGGRGGAGGQAWDAAAEAAERRAHEALLQGLGACTGEDYVGAVELFQTAFVSFREAGDARRASLCQKVISLLFIHIKDVGKVRAAYRKARGVLETAGMRDEAARLMMFAGDFEADAGAERQADRNFEIAVQLCQRIGYAEGEIQAECRHGLVIARRGKVADARAHIALAHAVAERDGDPRLVAYVDEQADKIVAAASSAVMSAKAERQAAPESAGRSIADLMAAKRKKA